LKNFVRLKNFVAKKPGLVSFVPAPDASLKLDYKSMMWAGTKVLKSLSERPMEDKALST
jgi:hypothetical protein